MLVDVLSSLLCCSLLSFLSIVDSELSLRPTRDVCVTRSGTAFVPALLRHDSEVVSFLPHWYSSACLSDVLCTVGNCEGTCVEDQIQPGGFPVAPLSLLEAEFEEIHAAVDLPGKKCWLVLELVKDEEEDALDCCCSLEAFCREYIRDSATGFVGRGRNVFMENVDVDNSSRFVVESLFVLLLF